MRRLILSLTALLWAGAAPLAAHEFWISPKAYTIEPGGQLVADIRVGQMFRGAAYAYIPNEFKRFDLVQGNAVMPVEGRIGDRPALKMAPPGEGLVVVVHQTGNSVLTYTEARKFRNFVTEKDFAWALEEHAARGLPETGFRERYSRYGKSLIAVGSGVGSDRAVGLETEIVALANPYTDDVSRGLPVRVLYQGQPRVDTQVEIFTNAPDGLVTKTAVRTDARGVAVIPVRPGHEYLVDAVVMRALEPPTANSPVWESLWASLTFAVPE